MTFFFSAARRFIFQFFLFPFVSSGLWAANLVTDETEHEEDNYEPSAYIKNRGKGYANRLGMATFEGTLYYASRSSNGDAILLRPAKQTGTLHSSHPTRDKNRFTMFNPGQGQLLVADLIPVGERLFLVAYLSDTVFVQAYRPAGSGSYPDRLVPGSDTPVIKNTGQLAGASVRQVFAFHGDRGLTIHVLWSGPNTDRSGYYFAAYRFRKGKMEPVAPPTRLPDDTSVQQPTACDGVSTHRINATTGDLEEVHVLAFLTRDNRVKIYGYYPDGTYRDQNCNITLPPNEGCGLILCEGQFEGDTNPDYTLSLVCFHLPPGGRHTGITVYGLSVPQLGGAISGPHSISFRNVDSIGNAQGTAVHWGVDKTVVRSLGSDRVEATKVSFIKRLQQFFRIACVNFYVRKITFGPSEDYQSFRTGLIAGNRFIAEDECKLLNTSTAIENPARANLLSAWTLIGVVHGMPPYVSHVPGRSFPTVSIDFSRTVTDTASTTTFTTDGKEGSIAVNIGGEYGGTPDAKKFLLDIGGSFTWSVENAHSKTLTTTHSATMGSRTTLDPVRVALRKKLRTHVSDDAVPENIGYLFFSAPVFASVTYNIVRPSGGRFSEQRLSALTAVDRRVNQQFSYLLDKPEMGPLETLRADGSNPCAALTEGIAPVARTNEQAKWRDLQVSGPRKRFPVDSSGFGASKDFGGGFTIAFSTETGESATDSTTYTRRKESHFRIGAVNIFNVELSGALTSSDGVSHEVTTTTTIGTGITGDYPRLPSDVPVKKITIIPHLFYTDPEADKKADWEPTLLQGAGSAWLLTWQVETFLTKPSSLARKPWKLHSIERNLAR